MDLGSIFLILALLTLVGLFISRPFMERKEIVQEAELNSIEHQRSALLAERDRILNALQELDFDHALGKIPEDEYPVQRVRLVQGGAEVLRQLDSLNERPSGGEEARLEAAIAARQSEAGPGTASSEVDVVAGTAQAGDLPQNMDYDDELEALLANRRRSRQEKAVGFCSQCGGALQKSDRFCPKCGASLT
jgi:hypothetical protein